MSEILFVSKPIAPPWNDGSKTLVRDIAGAFTRHDPVLLGVRGGTYPMARGRIEPLFYAPNEGFGLSGLPAMRLAARLASGRRGDLWHFVFAPNVRTSRTARALSKLRRVPTVQTVASVPADDEDLGVSLFGDRVVVLSRRTEQRFLERGVARERLVRIPPCAAPVPSSADARAEGRRRFALPVDAPVVVFPGDLERDRGAALLVDAVASMPRALGVVLVIAARRKTHRSAEAERVLRERAARLGLGDHVRWVGETAAMHGLLAAADVVALPATDLVAKVDLPIVLLEALSLGAAVVVARGSSADELADDGAAVAVEPHAEALGRTLEEIVTDTSARRAERGRAARGAFEQRYRPDRVARVYESLYDDVLR